MRMRGLAASFGARRLMDAAAAAQNGASNRATLRKIERAIAALED